MTDDGKCDIIRGKNFATQLACNCMIFKNHEKERIMKKVLLSIILVLSFTVGFCLTVSASDTGYGSFTYVNPFYQDSEVPSASYSMRAAV